ncbi:MAG: DinB family protein, partial [Aeromonas veronii]
MSNKTLQSLFHYKRWADSELLDAIAMLDAQQYGEAHHTCLRIFNHIHVVDAIFKANLLGERHDFTATNTPETPTLTALRSTVTELDNWLVDYVTSL